MLSKSEMGLSEPGLVTANRFNFLLTQLYRAGDKEGELRPVYGPTQDFMVDERSPDVESSLCSWLNDRSLSE